MAETKDNGGPAFPAKTYQRVWSKEAMDAFYQKFQLDYGNQEAFEI